MLATGGTPRRLPFGGDHIVYFQTLDDYTRLSTMTESGDRFTVIGGGFIGSEIAAALAMKGKQVVIIVPEETIGARVFPRPLGQFINDYYRQKGVEVLPRETAVGLETRAGRLALTTRRMDDSSQRELLVDGVAAGIGIQPNVALAEAAGLAVDNGIVVEEFLLCVRVGVWAPEPERADPEVQKRSLTTNQGASP